MSIHVVLVSPEIHRNTGNAGRTCLAGGATLHLIEPLGFSLDEREGESVGLPPELLARYRDRLVAMPIVSPRVRSLNLSTSVAIGVHEVLRQRR